MSELIRVRLDSGTEQSVPKPRTVDPARYEVLDKPATDRSGRPLPPKFPAKKKPGQKAATEKESN